MRAKKAERQSNIELLRVLAILGVVVLHYNNPVLGGGHDLCSRRRTKLLSFVLS